MKRILSFEMKRCADYLIFAAGLTLNKVHHISQVLEEILKDDTNFDTKADQPLTLSKKGLSAIKRVDPIFTSKTLPDLIKILDNAILDGSSENEELKLLNIYLQRTQRKTPGKWLNIQFKGKDFDTSKKIFSKMLSEINSALSALDISPETLKRDEKILREQKNDPKKEDLPPDYGKYLNKTIKDYDHIFEALKP